MNRITIGEESSRTNREKEVYRTLRTNIEFTGVENRAIAITSCTPNDGKTTVSYNLACAFADGGKKNTAGGCGSEKIRTVSPASRFRIRLRD